MTKVTNGRLLVIEPEPPQQCDLCAKIAELRPYGPNGEKICFDCMTATPEMEEAARQQFQKRIDGTTRIF